MPADSGWKPCIVMMGVSGSGKTTVGSRVADALGWDFLDADDFHPAENIVRMQAGQALTDEDRRPWLEGLRQRLHDPAGARRGMVLACSGLRRAYRDVLRNGPRPLHWAFLHGSHAVLRMRLEGRAGHFFDPRLLSSQLATLEEPQADEEMMILDIERQPAELVEAVIGGLTDGTTRHA